MKNINFITALILSVLFVCLSVQKAEAQIWKKLEKKAENAVTRKLEQKTEKETNKVMDTILGNDGNNSTGSTAPGGTSDGQNNSQTNDNSTVAHSETETVTMYKKSDWVPGEDIILFDDFASDPVGDFPQLWNTNGSGELITLSDNPKVKWLKLYNDTWYEPDLPKDLPKEFTVEFDVRTYNISDNNTSQTAGFWVYFGDGKKPLKIGRRYVSSYFSPYQKWVKEQYLKSIDYEGAGELAAGKTNKDIREVFKGGMHVAISVNGKRYRTYVNGEKLFDAPRAINDTENFSSILFDTYGIGDDQAILITNLRVAEGLPEPRNKLFKTGSYSTTAITFDVDSDKLKPEAYGIIKQIAEAINSEAGKSILITGHTDSDGSDEHNMDLSNRRALAVKNALVNEFGVDASRLTIVGKGESEPVASNDTAMNKAKNRRTEFIVQ
ncbi:OmpA family protein [Aequorivita sp. F47161]|uniref:OmpA family protein n=1 Tax=Aequorivita vitellina TaxID=2874475 RepID=A0A9X1QVC5_9FLAO|nr:OmpA family protein [Aequorivita vitellina]MCG2419025.1 OmpA family protein [Aequorivita vitellina]